MANHYQTQRRQLYILPTRAGWLYGLTLLALFLAALKYNHQAIFLLTFLLASIGQVTSLYTHKNLLDIVIRAKPAEPVFAGETAIFPVELYNPGDKQRHGIWLLCDSFKKHLTLPASGTTQQHVSVPAKQRGRLGIPAIILSSQYPIGILFSWTRAFNADVECIIYPQPRDLLPEPQATVLVGDDANDNATLTTKGSDDFSSLRNYAAGDRLRDVHWPALAKGGQLVSKEYTSPAPLKQIFNWQQVAQLGLEDKLSQLAHWIVQAEQRQQDYQLTIPGFNSPYSHGPQHQHLCLQQLADYKES